MYMQMQQTNAAVAVLDRILNNPRVDWGAVLAAAGACAHIGNIPRLEAGNR